jgi:hypothetical protein
MVIRASRPLCASQLFDPFIQELELLVYVFFIPFKRGYLVIFTLERSAAVWTFAVMPESLRMRILVTVLMVMLVSMPVALFMVCHRHSPLIILCFKDILM